MSDLVKEATIAVSNSPQYSNEGSNPYGASRIGNDLNNDNDSRNVNQFGGSKIGIRDQEDDDRDYGARPSSSSNNIVTPRDNNNGTTSNVDQMQTAREKRKVLHKQVRNVQQRGFCAAGFAGCCFLLAFSSLGYTCTIVPFLLIFASKTTQISEDEPTATTCCCWCYEGKATHHVKTWTLVSATFGFFFFLPVLIAGFFAGMGLADMRPWCEYKSRQHCESCLDSKGDAVYKLKNEDELGEGSTNYPESGYYFENLSREQCLAGPGPHKEAALDDDGCYDGLKDEDESRGFNYVCPFYVWNDEKEAVENKTERSSTNKYWNEKNGAFDRAIRFHMTCEVGTPEVEQDCKNICKCLGGRMEPGELLATYGTLMAVTAALSVFSMIFIFLLFADTYMRVTKVEEVHEELVAILIRKQEQDNQNQLVFEGSSSLDNPDRSHDSGTNVAVGRPRGVLISSSLDKQFCMTPDHNMMSMTPTRAAAMHPLYDPSAVTRGDFEVLLQKLKDARHDAERGGNITDFFSDPSRRITAAQLADICKCFAFENRERVILDLHGVVAERSDLIVYMPEMLGVEARHPSVQRMLDECEVIEVEI